MPNKKADAAMKRDIASAVDSLPDLIAKEVYATREPAAGKSHTVLPKEDLSKRRTLWACVGIMAALVFGMWIWNARTVLYDMKGNRSVEAKIASEVKEDLNAIIDSIDIKPNEKTVVEEEKGEENVEKNVTEAKLREAIEALVATTTKQIASSTNESPIFPNSEPRIER